MREIKFRAFNVATKTMIDLKKITPLALNMDVDGLFIPFSDGLIIQQFTGLFDKNGKEIYEGDVLKYTAHDGYGLFPGRLTVKWIAESGCFGYSHSDQSFSPNYISPFTEHDELQYDVLNYCEIIGNIYETPDLIK